MYTTAKLNFPTFSEEIKDYYKELDSNITVKQASAFIYGGEDLSKLIKSIDFNLKDKKKLKVDIRLTNKDGSYTYLNKVSFAQLTVESSTNLNKRPVKNWNKLSVQQRLEICQQELSRWSLILKTKDFKPETIEWGNDERYEYIELVNNCTTNKGFELKVKVRENGELIKYHGSFNMPSTIYEPLCQQQAGGMARQGWYRTKGEIPYNKYHGLIKPKEEINAEFNPAFGYICWEEKYLTHDKIKINLNCYRRLKQANVHTGNIIINKGIICYKRWEKGLGQGAYNEYHDKPYNRKLLTDGTANKFVKPPKTYEEIYKANPPYRFPLFEENGVYNILKPQSKPHYGQLEKINQFQINSLESGNQEFVLINPGAEKEELHRIVIGNIHLDDIPEYPLFLTIDRFCFSPRTTTMAYDANWLPASVKQKVGVKYAFLLTKNNQFIQAESWGVERVILSKENGKIVIDLISYERILPVWQGEMEIGGVEELVV